MIIKNEILFLNFSSHSLKHLLAEIQIVGLNPSQSQKIIAISRQFENSSLSYFQTENFGLKSVFSVFFQVNWCFRLWLQKFDLENSKLNFNFQNFYLVQISINFHFVWVWLSTKLIRFDYIIFDWKFEWI